MKKIILAGLFSLSLLGGLAVAQQPGEKKQESSMRGMMHEMMMGQQKSEGGMEGMMQMMKMMEQCSAMMEQSPAPAGPAQPDEGQGRR